MVSWSSQQELTSEQLIGCHERAKLWSRSRPQACESPGTSGDRHPQGVPDGILQVDTAVDSPNLCQRNKSDKKRECPSRLRGGVYVGEKAREEEPPQVLCLECGALWWGKPSHM